MAQIKITVDSLNKICRTCLSTNTKLKSFKNNEDLLSMLIQWVPIKLDENDLLPKQICVVCISKLNIIHNFVRTSVKAESHLKMALENDPKMKNELKMMPEAANDLNDDSHDSNSDGSNFEDDISDDDSDSFNFSLPEDDLFEYEEHKLKMEEVKEINETKNEIEVDGGHYSEFEISNIQSIPEEFSMIEERFEHPQETNLEIAACSSSFLGFNREEINNAKNNLDKYTETVQTETVPTETAPNLRKRFFDFIKHKCYLCENNLNFRCDKLDLKTLEFSTLSDDNHVLCKKRIKVLRKIIKDLYLKQDELNSLNNSWQKIFLQQTEKVNDRRDPQLPTNPVTNKPTKAHEIGYRRDGQVHLGHLTWIPETDFDKVFRHSLGPHKFLINMALTLFGAETLAKSTITGVSKNGVRKAPLNAIRMCALKSSLKYYMKEYNVPEYYQKDMWKNFNSILARKISMISAAYRKRCLGDQIDVNNKKKAKYCVS